MNKKSFMAVVWLAFISILFLVSNSSAAPISPSGGIGSKTWDFTITGADYGAAYLTFSDDGTDRLITGYVNMAPGHGIAGKTITIGSTYVYGQWSYDEKNRVIAYLNNEPTDDVRFDVTNLVGVVSKNQKKLTLYGQTDYGKLKFSGTVAAVLDELPDLWTIVVDKKESKMTFVEIFSVDPSGDLNSYNMTGLTADRCLKGSALLSKVNDLDVTIAEAVMPDSSKCSDVAEDDWTVYSAYGKLNLNTLQGNLRGAEEGDGSKKITMLVLASNSSAALISPSGGIGSKTWDLTITGADYGAAYLTFSDDGTDRLITGYVNMASGHGIAGKTITFGSTYVYGQWSYDEKNRVIAYLNNEPTDDVRFDVTNLVGVVSKNQKKLTLYGQTDYGKLKFSGTVAAALDVLPDLWTIVVNKKESKMTFVEIFSVDPSGDLNSYNMAGLAADRCVKGSALLSKLHDLVVTISEAEMPDSSNCNDVAEGNWTGYSAYGKLNLKTLQGNLDIGAEEGDGSKKITMRVLME